MFQRIWRNGKLLGRTLLAVALALAVGLHFRNILKGIDPAQLPVRVRVELLVPAGLLYLLAHLCWSTFWVRLLHNQGMNVSWLVGLRAYYLSQLGKYVPGKVAVLGMRVVLLRHHGGHPIPVAVTAIYETLSSMAAGALLGVLFLPTLGGAFGEKIPAKTTAFLAVAGLPIGIVVLNKLATWIVRRRRGPDAPRLPAPSIFLLAQGLVHGACGYCLLALSLSLTVVAILPEAPALTAAIYAADIATVALSYVVGFVVVFAPGGFGAREAVMQWALTPQFEFTNGEQAASLAIVVAVMLRLTWTIAEVVIGVPLYLLKPAPTTHVHHEAPMNDPPQPPPPVLSGASQDLTPPTPVPEGSGEGRTHPQPLPEGRGARTEQLPDSRRDAGAFALRPPP